MLTRVVALALVLLPALAAADPTDTPPLTSHATEEHRFALAVNGPFGWSDGNVGVSAYAGVSPHVAIRANVARYNYNMQSSAGDIISVLAGGDGDEAYRSGGFFDVGAGAVWYPRRLWSGLMLEAGLLRRAEHTHMDDEFADPVVVDRHVRTYGVRVLGGWSWLIKDRAFIGLALGWSYGHATGTEATQKYETNQMTVTRHVSEGVGATEWYLRFGAAF